jgi:hypothetical protein
MIRRFHFPQPVPTPAWVLVPPTLMAGISHDQLALARQIYQQAWERTQAVLTPTRYEKLLQSCSN